MAITQLTSSISKMKRWGWFYSCVFRGQSPCFPVHVEKLGQIFTDNITYTFPNSALQLFITSVNFSPDLEPVDTCPPQKKKNYLTATHCKMPLWFVVLACWLRSWQTFPTEARTVNTREFPGQAVSVATTQLCRCSTEAAVDSLGMSWCDWFPRQRCLHRHTQWTGFDLWVVIHPCSGSWC